MVVHINLNNQEATPGGWSVWTLSELLHNKTLTTQDRRKEKEGVGGSLYVLGDIQVSIELLSYKSFTFFKGTQKYFCSFLLILVTHLFKFFVRIPN